MFMVKSLRPGGGERDPANAVRCQIPQFLSSASAQHEQVDPGEVLQNKEYGERRLLDPSLMLGFRRYS